MVTHDPFAASYCDRVVYISDGVVVKEIIRTGTRKDFLENIIEHFSYTGECENE